MELRNFDNHWFEMDWELYYSFNFH